MRRGIVVCNIVVWAALAGAAHAEPPAADVDGGGAPAELPADPEAPTVGASLDRAEGYVGDRLTLTVSAIGKKSVTDTVRLPEPLALGKLEVLEVGRTDRDLGDGKWSRRFQLQVTAWEPGEVEVPGITLAYTSTRGEPRTVATSTMPVQIRSLVPADDPAAQAQPLKPTRAVIVEDRRLLQYLAWGAAALAGVAIFALVYRWLRRRRRRMLARPAPAPPAQPPHVVALDRLRALRARGDFGRDDYRPFNFEVAEILRAYLGARFGFDSLELTTTELLAELDRVGLPRTDGTLAARVTAFLGDTDLVKFAHAPSDDARALAALAEAEAIVEALVPRPATQPQSPPPPPPPEENRGAA